MNVEEPYRKSEGAPSGIWRRAFPILLLSLAVAAAYSNTLWNGFHLDDFYRIRDNPEIRQVAPVLRHFADPGTISGSRGVSESVLTQIGQYRPLLPLTLSLNYAAGGLELPGYHLVNIALHLASCVLVFLLVSRLLTLTVPKGIEGRKRACWAALLVALVYGVHPLSGYPVNYILARDLLLMQVFLLGSLLVHARSSERFSAWRWMATLVLLELALLSKVTAAVAPLLILAWEWTVMGKDLRTRRPWARAAPYAVVVLSHIGLARLFLDFGDLSRVQQGSGWSWTYALTQADVHVSEYLKNFLWPEAIRMAPYVVPRTSLGDPRVLLGLAVIAGTLVLAVRFRRTAPAIAFAILGYWSLMIPESSLVPISHLAVHYRAFPSSWLLYVAACLLIARAVKPRLALALGTTTAIVLALATFSMNRVYRSEASLWAHSVRYGGEALAHMNYAMSLPDRTDARVREHLERAVEMNPNYVLAHVNLGLLTMDLGQIDAGLARLRWVTQMAPEWPEAHYWLSVGLDRVGELDEAISEAQAAAAIDPENLEYGYRLALASSRAGDFEGALEASRRVLDFDPDHTDARFVEAYALQMTGATEESTRVYERYLAARPDDAEARFDLAYGWVSLGRCGDAEPHLRTILSAHPEHAAAKQYLGICAEEERGGSPAVEEALERQYEAAFSAYRSGDYRRSLEFLRLVEAMRPNHEDALFLKGFDLQMLGRLEEAVIAYDAYLSTHPDHAQVHFNVGHALASSGRCTEAIGHLERTLQLKPDYQEARVNLSRCLEAGAGIQSAEATGAERING
jgi:tetratricopeptide (TPR) repeat protein